MSNGTKITIYLHTNAVLYHIAIIRRNTTEPCPYMCNSILYVSYNVPVIVHYLRAATSPAGMNFPEP